MALSETSPTYYDRTMSDDLVRRINQDFPWLVEYVKSNKELDFQTGNDLRRKRSWFSVYRGTGRVMTISAHKVTAADSYKELMPTSFFLKPTVADFDIYLEKIRQKSQLNRYYETNEKKEGFYQNLIGRRYTFQNKEDDDFIIIDKEFVLGFCSDEIRESWCSDIVKKQEDLIKGFRQICPRLPKDISPRYAEFDFLGLNWDGDIIIMELKQNDPQKTYLSPVQVGYYYRQFSKLLKEDDGQLYRNIKKMIQQKIEMGLINLPVGKKLPEKLSGKVKSCVIVGEDKFSETIIQRYQLARQHFLPEMKAYTCTEDGTLRQSELEFNYKDREAKKQASLVEEGSFAFYGACNRGMASWSKNGKVCQGKSRSVLQSKDREKNLFEPIREEVVQYFKEAEIKWWGMELESREEPTAHMLSSQISIINHLFAIRNDEDAIKRILGGVTGIVYDRILPSLIPGDGLLSFEFVYENKTLLGEKHETRGAKCTSVDALIYAEKNGEKWLIPIEWKYTETYNHSKVFNYPRYSKLVSSQSRLTSWHDLYSSDPFYELGRQTLLMEKIIEKYPEKANRFLHLCVVPEGNDEMRNDAFKFQESIKESDRKNFMVVDPCDLMAPLQELACYKDLIIYLKTRYW